MWPLTVLELALLTLGLALFGWIVWKDRHRACPPPDTTSSLLTKLGGIVCCLLCVGLSTAQLALN